MRAALQAKSFLKTEQIPLFTESHTKYDYSQINKTENPIAYQNYQPCRGCGGCDLCLVFQAHCHQPYFMQRDEKLVQGRKGCSKGISWVYVSFNQKAKIFFEVGSGALFEKYDGQPDASFGIGQGSPTTRRGGSVETFITILIPHQ